MPVKVEGIDHVVVLSSEVTFEFPMSCPFVFLLELFLSAPYSGIFAFAET